MTYLAVTFATVAVLWLPVLYAVVTAPEGWEDRDGFHTLRNDAGSLHAERYTK